MVLELHVTQGEEHALGALAGGEELAYKGAGSPRFPWEEIEACTFLLLLPAAANCLRKRQDSLGFPFGREEGTTLTDTRYFGACVRYEARKHCSRIRGGPVGLPHT